MHPFHPTPLNVKYNVVRETEEYKLDVKKVVYKRRGNETIKLVVVETVDEPPRFRIDAHVRGLRGSGLGTQIGFYDHDPFPTREEADKELESLEEAIREGRYQLEVGSGLPSIRKLDQVEGV